MSSYWTFQIVYSTAGPVKTCQTLRTITAGGGREQKINPVHYLQPSSYPVTTQSHLSEKISLIFQQTILGRHWVRQGNSPVRQTKNILPVEQESCRPSTRLEPGNMNVNRAGHHQHFVCPAETKEVKGEIFSDNTTIISKLDYYQVQHYNTYETSLWQYLWPYPTSWHGIIGCLGMHWVC